MFIVVPKEDITKADEMSMCVSSAGNCSNFKVVLKWGEAARVSCRDLYGR
jgi:hypothetical protein